MEIQRKYLQKYLHDLAIAQLSEEYRQNGYVVSTEEDMGNYRADIVARNNEETIVIEVRTGRQTADRRQAVAAIADYVRLRKGYKFLAVIATPPKDKKLEIIGLQSVLCDYLIEHFPNELDELSTHTRIEGISDIDINELVIFDGKIHAVGDGVIDVELQVGSDLDVQNDDGHTGTDSFPFSFAINLVYSGDMNLILEEVEKLSIDTSSFYS